MRLKKRKQKKKIINFRENKKLCKKETITWDTLFLAETGTN